MRLTSQSGHDLLVDLLSDSIKKVYEQENVFFDGMEGDLSRKRCVMRLRFFNVDEKAVLTVRGKMLVSEGIGRAEEEEAEVNVQTARIEFLRNPSEMLTQDIAPVLAAKQYDLLAARVF